LLEERLEPLLRALLEERVVDRVAVPLLRVRVVDRVAVPLLRVRVVDRVAVPLLRVRVVDRVAVPLLRVRVLEPAARLVFVVRPGVSAPRVDRVSERLPAEDEPERVDTTPRSPNPAVDPLPVSTPRVPSNEEPPLSRPPRVPVDVDVSALRDRLDPRGP